MGSNYELKEANEIDICIVIFSEMCDDQEAEIRPCSNNDWFLYHTKELSCSKLLIKLVSSEHWSEYSKGVEGIS